MGYFLFTKGCFLGEKWRFWSDIAYIFRGVVFSVAKLAIPDKGCRVGVDGGRGRIKSNNVKKLSCCPTKEYSIIFLNIKTPRCKKIFRNLRYHFFTVFSKCIFFQTLCKRVFFESLRFRYDKSYPEFLAHNPL